MLEYFEIYSWAIKNLRYRDYFVFCLGPRIATRVSSKKFICGLLQLFYLGIHPEIPFEIPSDFPSRNSSAGTSQDFPRNILSDFFLRISCRFFVCLLLEKFHCECLQEFLISITSISPFANSNLHALGM